ncbi:MAG: hypothetical protein J6Y02_11870 [Pseudobutyrivibrio sp.]|nr:hypothetical protein [Pseudobutyrivibrio sp.]
MEEKNVTAGIAVGTGILGFLGGIFVNKYHNLKHTPEVELARLESTKAECRRAEAEAEEAQARNSKVLSELRATKKEYQNEIRGEIEEKVRKELGDYISKADATYAEAKKEKDLATARLELAKRIEKDNSSTTKYNF